MAFLFLKLVKRLHYKKRGEGANIFREKKDPTPSRKKKWWMDGGCFGFQVEINMQISTEEPNN